MFKKIKNQLRIMKHEFQVFMEWVGGIEGILKLLWIQLTAPRAFLPVVISSIIGALVLAINFQVEYFSHVALRLAGKFLDVIKNLYDVMDEFSFATKGTQQRARAKNWSSFKVCIEHAKNIAWFARDFTATFIYSTVDFLVSPVAVIPTSLKEAFRAGYEAANVVFDSAIMRILRRPLRNFLDEEELVSTYAIQSEIDNLSRQVADTDHAMFSHMSRIEKRAIADLKRIETLEASVKKLHTATQEVQVSPLSLEAPNILPAGTTTSANDDQELTLSGSGSERRSTSQERTEKQSRSPNKKCCIM